MAIHLVDGLSSPYKKTIPLHHYNSNNSNCTGKAKNSAHTHTRTHTHTHTCTHTPTHAHTLQGYLYTHNIMELQCIL